MCLPGLYRSMQVSQDQCLTCRSECTGSDEFEAVGCTGAANRECHTVSCCDGYQVLAKEPTATTDRVCDDLSYIRELGFQRKLPLSRACGVSGPSRATCSTSTNNTHMITFPNDNMNLQGCLEDCAAEYACAGVYAYV